MNARSPLYISLLVATCTGLTASSTRAQGVIETERVLGGCADSLRDANTTACLEAAVDATLGQLFPLSLEFYLNPFTRFIGCGTTNPLYPFHVVDNRSDVGVTSMSIRNVAEGGTGLTVFSTDSTASSTNFGVRGSAAASHGSGVAGFNFSGSFVTASGVSGTTSGGGAGVAGAGIDPADDNDGVYGSTQSDTVGRGVLGVHFSNVGLGAGVDGRTYSTSGGALGVRGEVNPVSPGGYSAGVYGLNRGTGSSGIGVRGTQNGSGWGVLGETVGSGVGVLGIAPAPGFAVYSSGDFGASGTKSFVQPHPQDASKEIRFVCLEGNESGTYFRGSARLVDGQARIEVPEEFRLASEPTSLTVQITGIGRGEIWTEVKNLDEIVIAGERDIEFDYLVNGVRRGFDGFQAIRHNRSFVPRFRGVPMEHVPLQVRDILVENGSLNADYTPNEATAYQMGWILDDKPSSDSELNAPAIVHAPDLDAAGAPRDR